MQLPFVLSIPHCGNQIPQSVRRTMALTDRQIDESVDLGTQEIFGAIPALAIVAARWSRLLVDLNRSPDKLDHRGVVARIDYHGRKVYQAERQPNPALIDRRIERYYLPFHTLLAQALMGSAVAGLVDCHSLNNIGPQQAPDTGLSRQDVVVSNNGDRSGFALPDQGDTTCPAALIHAAAKAFESQGFTVALNYPYRGGYIINHYGAWLQGSGRFAVQIEINQRLFMQPGDTQADKARTGLVATRIHTALTHWARDMRSVHHSLRVGTH